MIKLMFERNNQFFIITIDKKKILYWDKIQNGLWGGPLQYLPPDPSTNLKIDMSRNRIPAYFKEMLKITAEELKEFDNAKDEKELMELVVRDCKKNGCKLVDTKFE